MDLATIRGNYPIIRHDIYLNHAATATTYVAPPMHSRMQKR